MISNHLIPKLFSNESGIPRIHGILLSRQLQKRASQLPSYPSLSLSNYPKYVSTHYDLVCLIGSTRIRKYCCLEYTKQITVCSQGNSISNFVHWVSASGHTWTPHLPLPRTWESCSPTGETSTITTKPVIFNRETMEPTTTITTTIIITTAVVREIRIMGIPVIRQIQRVILEILDTRIASSTVPSTVSHAFDKSACFLFGKLLHQAKWRWPNGLPFTRWCSDNFYQNDSSVSTLPTRK